MNTPVKQASREKQNLPPWLFQHRTLTDALENAKPVNQETLTNTLNHIHFMDGYVFALLGHTIYEQSILLKAYPRPCLDSELTCHWADESIAGLKPEEYGFHYLVVADGRSLLLVPANIKEIDNKSFTIELPSTSPAVGQRQARRYTCHGIDVELIQAGLLKIGELLDFSPNGFCVRVKPMSSFSLRRFNADDKTIIHLKDNQQIIFSGPCKCIRQHNGHLNNEIVLAPIYEKVNRPEADQIRNPRQCLAPTPTLIFNHPFLKKRFQMEIIDISTSGLSVCEEADEGILMQDMVIPEVIIDFAGLRIKCAVQVIYRLEKKGIRCGLAILDMAINAYTRLADRLTNAIDPHAHISNEVDMDDLWAFLFESGFIYPTKYRLVKSHRERFKETYKKLYQQHSEIAGHFTYQKNGQIYGHLSMVKAYERTWMIQHHASRAVDNISPGFTVLKQIIYYLNYMYRLPSAKTDYVMCFFRPQSKFADRVFGGFARALNNPKGCSTDPFTYLTYPTLSLGTRLPEGWSLQECSALDLWELKRFYEYHSGGLLLDILRLGDKDLTDDSLENLYRRHGLVRRWKAYSLTHDGELNAILIADQSDPGLNLSELLNGIKIMVTKPEGLHWDILSIAIGQIAPLYDTDNVPLLIHPLEYVEAKGILYEKQYQLWIYDVHYVSKFKEFLQKKFRVNYWK